jgi:hypothetical protein
MSLEPDAQPSQKESQTESSTEEIVIRIPRGANLTMSYSSSTPNGTLPLTPGLDIGTVQSLVALTIQQVRNLNLRSLNDKALSGDYNAEPIVVALQLLWNEVLDLLMELEHNVHQLGQPGNDG